MRNAFVSAFARSLEGSITLRDVKKNLNELDPDKPAERARRRAGRAENAKSAQKPKPGPAGKT